MFFEDAVSDIGELEVRVPGAGESHPDDWLSVDIDFLDDRVVRFAWQGTTDTRNAIANVVGSLVDIAAKFKFDGDNRALLLAGGGEGLDAFDGGKLLLEDIGNRGFDDIRAGAAIEGGDRDYGWIDIRVFADRQASECNSAQEDND